MFRKVYLTTLLFLVVVSLSACGKLFGDVRPDLNDKQYDQPTYGGAWPEGGVLAQEENDLKKNNYGKIGHNDRNLASAAKGYYHDQDYTDYEQRAKDLNQKADDEEAAVRAQPQGIYQNKIYKMGERATSRDFIDEDQNEGSLWASHGETNYYFTKNKIRSVGDLVTVTLEKDFVRDAQAEFMRSLNPDEREFELRNAQENLKTDAIAKNKKKAPGTPAKGAAEEPEEPDVRKAMLTDVKASEIFELKEGDKIMAEVMERYPNGNYKIRGVKRVPYRNTFRNVTMLAIAKGTSVSDKDELTTGNLYEYKMEVYP